MKRAAWSPPGLLSLFDKLGKFGGPKTLIEQLFASHPPSAERSEAIRNEMRVASLPQALAMDSAAFRDMKLALRRLPPPTAPKKD